jgi:hypothetical protein
MNGAFEVVEVDAFPQSPTTSDPISLTLGAIFTGTISPPTRYFELPVAVMRNDTAGYARGVMSFRLTSGTISNGQWSGGGSVVLPPQTQGYYIFSVSPAPYDAFNFSGTIAGYSSQVVPVVSLP